MNLPDFIKIAKTRKKLPKNIRIYLVSKKHYFLNDGILKDGFDSKLVIQNDRDSVLSAFSKMAFIFDEIMRLRIVGYGHNQNSTELMYLLHLIPVNRKIRTFFGLEIIFTRICKRYVKIIYGSKCHSALCFIIRSGIFS